MTTPVSPPTSGRSGRARRAFAALLAVAGVSLTGALAGIGPGTAVASSHREAPYISTDPAVDNTDLYAFANPKRQGYTTIIANFAPFSEPNGGPNFFPFATDATYNINVDSDGDAKPNAIFRYTFKTIDKRGGNTFLYNNGPVTTLDDENLLFRQTYTLESSFNGQPFKVRATDVPVAPSRVGLASMPDYAALRKAATVTLPGGWGTFAGQADDPFYLDLRVFDLLYGGNLKEVGQDTLAGYNVNSIAIDLPWKDLALNGDATRNPNIGIWTTTERAKVRMPGQVAATAGNGNGDRVQVSRLGHCLVNEVVIPANLKDAFNSLSPDKDATIPAVVARVTDPELPKLIEGIYKVPAPAAPRNDLVEIFLTGITTKANGPIKADLNSQLNNADVNPAKFQPSEMLRLNLTTPVTDKPNRLGVLGGDLQGYPNGRRLADDCIDISLQAVEGAAQTGKLVDALAAGDAVDANDNQFGEEFPFLALPNVGAVNKGGGTAMGVSAGSDNGGQSNGNANGNSSASPSGEAAPNTTPSAFSAGTGMTAVAIATSAVALTLGVLLFMGWWRRRNVRPLGGGSGGSPDNTIQF